MLIVTGLGAVTHPLKLTDKAIPKSGVKRRIATRGGLDDINGPFGLGADRDFAANDPLGNFPRLLIERGLLFSGDNTGLSVG